MLTWQDKLDSLGERIGEPDWQDNATNTEQDTPYFDWTVAEKWLYMSSLFYLRSVPPQELEAIGSDAIQVVTASAGGGIVITTTPIPQNVLKVLDAQIDTGVGFRPAEYVPPTIYLQMLTCAANESLIYTLIGGFIAVKGTANITITCLVEPALASFQNDDVILPPGYDEDIVNRAKSLLMISDYLPAGRL
jgi:hypothetical protein